MRVAIFCGYVAFFLAVVAFVVFLAGEFFGRIGYMSAGALVAATVAYAVKDYFWPSVPNPRR